MEYVDPYLSRRIEGWRSPWWIVNRRDSEL
jgi:hypothetical protein